MAGSYYPILTIIGAVTILFQSQNLRMIRAIAKYADTIYTRSILVTNALIMVWIGVIFVWLVYQTTAGAKPTGDPVRLVLSLAILIGIPLVVSISVYTSKRRLLDALMKVKDQTAAGSLNP